MIKTAVVILNWNGVKYLQDFLPSVVKYSSSPDTVVYVADNGSTDSSVAMLKKDFPSVKLIVNDKNYGFSEGYNKALAHIDAKYYVLLNSDVEVTENWIEPIIDMMEQDKSIGAAMPKIKSYHNKDYFEYAGAAGGYIDKYGFPFCKGRILNEIEKDNNQYEEVEEIFWASGASFFVRADLYKSTGGLDTDFFAHMEEIDVCWRLKNMGYKIMYNPKSVVYHVGGGTLPNSSPHKLYLNFRNNLLLLYKNLSKEKFKRTIALRFVFDTFAGLTFLLQFKYKEFNAVVKAHRSFFKMKKSYENTRKNLLIDSKNYNHKQILNGSIVVDFFIKKKRKFNELDF